MTHHTTTFDSSREQKQQQEPAQGASKASGGGAKALTAEERERAWKALYRSEHSDFKGRLQDGTETVMHWAKYGGGLASLATITDAELIERSASATNRAGARR